MASFERTLNYSSVNEDVFSEAAALSPSSNGRLVVVTGSGARSLDLTPFWNGPIVSIDSNAAQTAILELKMAALAKLDLEQYAAFLGLEPSADRLRTYKGLREGLSEMSRRFWDGHAALLARGALYQGRWEKHFGLLSLAIARLKPGAIQSLWEARDLSEQLDLWRRDWTEGRLAFAVRAACRPWVWAVTLGDPGFVRYVPAGFSPASYILERLSQASQSWLFRDSAFATLLFQGRLTPKGPLPPHLSPDYHNTVRAGSSRIECATNSLQHWLADQPPGSIDAFSLSDIASYTDPDQYERIWQEIVRTSSPAARVCERQFLVKREIPTSVRTRVERDPALESQLAVRDTSIFYSFVVGVIQ